MASKIKVDEIEPNNPILFVDILGTNFPRHNNVELLSAFPHTPNGAVQTALRVTAGTGAPNNAHGSDGWIYLRSDGGASTTIYHKRAGTWVGII